MIICVGGYFSSWNSFCVYWLSANYASMRCIILLEISLKKKLSLCWNSLGSFCANFHQHRLELIRWSMIIYDAIRSLWTTFYGRFKVASQLNCNKYYERKPVNTETYILSQRQFVHICIVKFGWSCLWFLSVSLLLYTAYLGFKLLVYDRHNLECGYRNITKTVTETVAETLFLRCYVVLSRHNFLSEVPVSPTTCFWEQLRLCVWPIWVHYCGLHEEGSGELW